MSTHFQVRNLRCEYLVNPLGIETQRPRLSWNVESDQRGQRQTAYQLLVASNREVLLDDHGDVWDSGQVYSSITSQVEYAGPRLSSRQRLWWKVRAWDKDGQPSEYSQPAWWEMGLLEQQEWRGEWIGASLGGGPHTSVPCPFLRKEFRIDQQVTSARLYATALGLYEFEINGQRVGEDVFTPGWTDYRVRIQYQSYDVTDLVQPGANALGAVLGDGWFCGHIGWGGRQFYGDRPRLLAQLEIVLADGSVVLIATDHSWKVNFGPLLESDLLMGESYDARLEFRGWSQAGCNDAGWQPVTVFPSPDVPLVAQCSPTVQRIQELKPVAPPQRVEHWPQPLWIYDLGQNMVGRARLWIRGSAGITVRLRFGEMLNPDGTLYTENLRSARQTDYYTLRGDPDGEVFEPRFTFHGFRYVEISGYPGVPGQNDLTGVVLHSATPLTGSFECSEPLLNQLQHNILWGQKSNFLEVPTDCPQRDERLGWTGDAQVFIRTAAFNMDVASFFTKWVQDLADSQSTRGQIPPVAPSVIGEVDGGPAWSDAFIICPWTIYLCYNDARMLEAHYPAMQRFVDYLTGMSVNLIRCHPQTEYREGAVPGNGDWLSINAETPKDLIGTAFLAHCAHLMSRIAAALGKNKDQARYQGLFEEVRRAFIERFVTPGGLVAGQTQTAYILALHFELLPEALRPAASQALVNDIQARGTHLSTGFVGTPYLLDVLTQSGKLDMAYSLLLQRSWPSWLYPVTQGATTIWERWDGWTHEYGFQTPKMNSFNHYAFGAVGAWLYSTLGGINLDPENPGYTHIIIRPRPGGGLTWAKTEYQSIQGKILCHWHLDSGRFILRVTIPANMTATVYIPTSVPQAVEEVGDMEGVAFMGMIEGCAVYKIESGDYRFSAII